MKLLLNKLMSRIFSLQARDINLIFCFIFLSIFISSCTIFPKKSQIHYLDNACLYPVENYLYTTCAPMRVSVDGKMYLIPSGFKTDLASIPRPLWSLYSPHNTKYIASAIMHDFMYSCDFESSRLDADNVFYYSLLEHGVKKRTAFCFWVALRALGWMSYKEGDTCTERFIDVKVPYKSVLI